MLKKRRNLPLGRKMWTRTNCTRNQEEDSFVTYLLDEKTEDFGEEKPVQQMKEMAKVPKEQELEKQIVFKVEREVVSRVKEKPD